MFKKLRKVCTIKIGKYQDRTAFVLCFVITLSDMFCKKVLNF